MNHSILCDTGPLVALLDRRDQWHAWAVTQMKKIRLPWLTTEAVISETCFLLAGLPIALNQIEAYAKSGALRLLSVEETIFAPTLSLMQRYANVPMSFADASLVMHAETLPQACIFTLDNDFAIYRRADGTPLRLLAPFIE